MSEPKPPQSIASTAIVLDSTFTGLAMLVVGLRFYTRTRLIKALGLDDFIILTSVAFSITYSALIIRQVHYGLGRHFDTLTDNEKLGMLKPFYFSILFYQLTLSSAKISISIQYLRFAISKPQRLACSIMLAFIIAYGTWTALSALLLCDPPAHFWNSNVKGHCMNELRLWFTNAGLNIATDFTLLILPMPIIYKLRVPRKQKIILVCILSLGAFVCVTSVVRLRSIYIISVSPDVSWTNVAAGYWSGIESNCSVICASLPTLRPLVSRFIPKLLGTSSNETSVVQSGGSSPFARQGSQTKGNVKDHPLDTLSNTDENDSNHFQDVENGEVRVITVLQQKSEHGCDRSDGAGDRKLVPTGLAY